MNRFICSYNMDWQNAFDDRHLVLIVRADNPIEALVVVRR